MSDKEHQESADGAHEHEHADEHEHAGDDEHADEHEHESGEDAAEQHEGSEAARRVASALGVGGEGTEAAEVPPDADEEAVAPNRVARRAEAAQRRKKRKGASARSTTDDQEVDEALPTDKNARAKELLKRRREQAEAPETKAIQLLPGEMVDDALARSSSAIGKWIRDNFNAIQWVIAGALVAGGGYIFYQSRVDKRDAGATTALMAGIEADRARVVSEDNKHGDAPMPEDKDTDAVKTYKTTEERADTALAAYKKVESDHAGTAPAQLARLGEAGDYLDKQDWAHALEAYSSVAASALAGADPDVKGRAIEGQGFAKEGKGDLDGALASFKELEAVDARGFKELGLYHQGRLWLAKGDKDKAKDFLKQVHDKLEASTAENKGFNYLQQMTDEALRRIDPSFVASKTPPGAPGAKSDPRTAEEVEKMKRQIMEQLKQKAHP